LRATIADMLPVAHAGHFLWILYLVPVVVVLGSIVKQLRDDRKTDGDDGVDESSDSA
jgi:hypothetical protein